MTFLRKFALTTLIAMAPVAASANTYVCQMSTTGQARGWIPTAFSVTFHGQAAVVNFGQTALQGRVARNNASGFTITASVEASSRTGQAATIQYSISYNARTTVARVRAQPLGYGNNFSARGNCAQQG